MDLPPVIADWLGRKGWRLRAHQAAMLARAREHRLLIAGTGAGKTLSGFLPTLADLARAQRDGLHTLYISPLKALAVDVRRNLLNPVEDMRLPVTVETRTGDTPADRKARQRQQPPNILLTTPESLSLLLSFPDSAALFADLQTIVVDEAHAFASSKRGDLLALAMARLSALAPSHVRVGLSATVADEDAYRAWLSPTGLPDPVTVIHGERGAEPDIGILLPEGRVPWSGHSGRYAAAQVYDQIRAHRTTLVFCNTRGLAELIFQDIWSENEDQLPIGVHHGSLAVEARRKVEGAMADGRLRALVCTASLDLGVDWGDIDLVIQMGAPKGSSRLIQRIGRANHRLDVPSKGLIVPGNRFEYLEARAALDAVQEGALDTEYFRPGALDVLAQHVMACACAAPFSADDLYAEVTKTAPYRDLPRDLFDETLRLVENGAYALRAYDKFRRIRLDPDGLWRVAHQRFVRQHRENAGIIVDVPVLSVRFKNGRKLGTVEDYFASTLRPGDTFYFAGLSLEVERFEAADLFVRASTRPARIPTYVGTRLALTTSLADRVRAFLHDREQWPRFPADVQEWLAMQERRSVLPKPGELLVETFERDGRHHLVAYSFEGWNAHQALGMLVTRRMAAAGLQPTGFVSNDYALAAYGLEPIRDVHSLFSADILEDEFKAWIEQSPLLKRAFREVAIIGGLVERQTTGQRKPGRALTISTDLIYDVLRRHEPDHLLLRAAWEDARQRLTDVGRLARLLETAQDRIVHMALPRVSPLAVPVLVLIGREAVRDAGADDAILAEAEALAAEAMRED